MRAGGERVGTHLRTRGERARRDAGPSRTASGWEAPAEVWPLALIWRLPSDYWRPYPSGPPVAVEHSGSRAPLNDCRSHSSMGDRAAQSDLERARDEVRVAVEGSRPANAGELPRPARHCPVSDSVESQLTLRATNVATGGAQARCDHRLAEYMLLRLAEPEIGSRATGTRPARRDGLLTGSGHARSVLTNVAAACRPRHLLHASRGGGSRTTDARDQLPVDTRHRQSPAARNPAVAIVDECVGHDHHGRPQGRRYGWLQGLIWTRAVAFRLRLGHSVGVAVRCGRVILPRIDGLGGLCEPLCGAWVRGENGCTGWDQWRIGCA